MSELPTSWSHAPLNDLGNWGSGGTPTRTNPTYYEDGSIPWLVIGDLNDGIVTQAKSSITQIGLESSAAKLIPPETLLVAMYGSIGKLGITGIECATNQAIAHCKPNTDAIYLKYLFYALLNARDSLISLGQGGAQQNISQGILKEHVVPVAPLPEQKRIADKLDAVLGRVDACRARLARVPDLLKRFRQSVLAAATSGRLTADWRQSRGIQLDKWGTKTLGAICESGRIITYGVIKLGDEVSDGVPCLRTSNVRWLRIDTEGMKRIAPRLSEDYSRTILRGGEVLVNVRGTLGGVAVAEASMAGWNVSREVAVVPVNQKILRPAFLAYIIGSEKIQSWLTGVQKGVAYTGINIEDLRMLPLQIPSMTEQQEIVRRVETLFAFADRIEARLNEAQITVDRLSPSTLAKAFRGELVPQDPADEPASALLERIRQERNVPTSTKRPTKRKADHPTPRAPKQKSIMTKSRFDEDVKGKAYLAGLLRNAQAPMNAEALFKLSELPLVDFYKQLAWEVQKGHIRGDRTKLEAVS